MKSWNIPQISLMEVIIEIILVNKKLTKFGVLWLVIDLHSCIRSCWQEIILYSFAHILGFAGLAISCLSGPDLQSFKYVISNSNWQEWVFQYLNQNKVSTYLSAAFALQPAATTSVTYGLGWAGACEQAHHWGDKFKSTILKHLLMSKSSGPGIMSKGGMRKRFCSRGHSTEGLDVHEYNRYQNLAFKLLAASS